MKITCRSSIPHSNSAESASKTSSTTTATTTVEEDDNNIVNYQIGDIVWLRKGNRKAFISDIPSLSDKSNMVTICFDNSKDNEDITLHISRISNKKLV